jgi:pseudaminic acid synthase
MIEIQVGNFNINNESPVFIIAELSANHKGSLEIALETVRAAKRAGANCIKLQTYTPDTITLNVNTEDFQINDTIWSGQTLYNLYKEAYTPWEWHEEIMKLAKEEGLECFSSPFDISSVDFLETLNVPAYKIASFEITDIPLIEYVASKQKPIIISTGIATLDDIQLAIEACKGVGNEQIILLKCTSSYPAPIEEANLVMITEYNRKFNVYSGLSDHTMGSLAPIVASTLGARVIEKHFILDSKIGGPDASFSMNEQEFKEMVDQVRIAEKSLGNIDFTISKKQENSRKFSRSLYVSDIINKGDIITKNNIRSVRPGYSLHPKYLNEILGKKSMKSFNIGDRIELSDFEK